MRFIRIKGHVLCVLWKVGGASSIGTYLVDGRLLALGEKTYHLR